MGMMKSVVTFYEWNSYKSLVVGFLRPVSCTGSPWDQSHLHTYSILSRKASNQNTNLAHSTTNDADSTKPEQLIISTSQH